MKVATQPKIHEEATNEPKKSTNVDSSSLSVQNLIGLSPAEVRRQLGTPDQSVDQSYDDYNPLAIRVLYATTPTVQRVSFGRPKTTGDSQPEVCGIRHADPQSACEAAWGKPVKTQPTELGYNKLLWHHNGYWLDVEIWNFDGEEYAIGKWKKGTVKHIFVSKQKPMDSP